MALTNQILIDEWCAELGGLPDAILTTIRVKIAPKLWVKATGEEGLANLICHIGLKILSTSKASKAGGSSDTITSIKVGDTQVGFAAIGSLDTNSTAFQNWLQSTTYGALYLMLMKTLSPDSFLPMPLC